MIEVSMFHHIINDLDIFLGPQKLYSVTSQELEKYLKHRSDYQNTVNNFDIENDKGKLITFDDGYRNNLEALPLLEKYNAKAIIFITTGFIDREAYPYEIELAQAIEKFDSLRLRDISEVSLKNEERKVQVYNRLREPLKKSTFEEKERFMNELAELNNYKRRSCQTERFLSWDEIVRLDENPLITIGAHTITHPVLTEQSMWTVYYEMRKSKKRIEEKLGHKIYHFSYPYGANNFVVRNLARLSGFKYGFTTKKRLIKRRPNLMALPRIEIKNLLKQLGN